MKKIKVGYLPLYIKLYDDSDPHYRDPMVAHMHLLVSMLEEQGLEIVLADVCRIKPEFEAAAKLFNDAEVDAVITQHLAYSPSLESIDALLSIHAPLIVFDTTPDYDLIARAADYNGIGRWTVEMFLMFNLGRPDVLPADDLGVRKGFQAAYRKHELPKPKALAEFGQRWAPYRTLAALYLWRAAGTDQQA